MPTARTIAFDGWVLRTELGELAKDGRKIRLQDQPLQILEELLTRPGELVTREQLIARLWPKGIVDFDTGLNSAVRKLRIALQDEAETPKYIETVPRKGYRFIGVIDPAVAEPPPSGSRPRRAYVYMAAAALTAVLLVGVALVAARRESMPQPAAAAPPSEVQDSRTIAVAPLQASTPGEPNELLALILTDVLRTRLASHKDVLVVASGSPVWPAESQLGRRELISKLHARFLLQGSAARAGDQLRTDVELIDTASGARLWSMALDRPATQAAALCDEILQRVAGTMRIDAAANKGDAPAINLEAYELYVRGQQLTLSERPADLANAVELFRRATILDTGFARAYLALGDLQIALAGDDRKLLAEGTKAIDRALELDPALGEAWVVRAWLVRHPDPVKAEVLYRKGLQLAPSYGYGYALFARFLFGYYRKGEAIEMMDRARRIDPLIPEFYLDQAFFLMVKRSDLAGHDRLLREALAISPGYRPALVRLASSKYEYSGEFAEGIRYIEQALARDPEGDGDALASAIYLDIEDAAAAKTVLREGSDPDHVGALVKLAQYERNTRRAAELARSVDPVFLEGGPVSPMAEALRDEAIRTGDFAPALEILEASYATYASPNEPRMWGRGLGLVYAHTLVLAGQAQRGHKLATSILAQLDTESVGRAENWLCRERAAAFAVLGDDERTLEQLAISLKVRKFYRWWYLAELDPLYEHLRADRRFQALARQAKQHRSEQRALVEEMRRKGEVPKRS
ncbi:MAG TPA: winged helix-turn-helix domain-containing protein [Steroidobacteraceae bacterium]|nr:winged helix-turn-helix domain-containing protein [Steroidobacteraceae bacterium]